MRCAFTLAVFGLTFVCGCAQGPKMVEVSGAVSWRGEPVESGDIIFEDATRMDAPDGLKITNGRYSGRIKPGGKVVRVFGTKLKPVPTGIMGQGEREQIFPSEFNSDSKIRIEVPDRDGNSFDFHLPNRAD